MTIRTTLLRRFIEFDRRWLTFAVAVALLGQVAQAQVSDEPSQTVVTVTTEPVPLAAAPASVTILSHDYITNSHAETAAELLRNAPFLQIAQIGATGGLTTVTIRGGKPNFTLVMIDGIPVNDITNLLGGSFDLSSLAVSNIDRIEVVRGPLSALYGSDAIGGVINFISQKPSMSPLLNFSIELGSILSKQAKVNRVGTWKGLQYSTGASWLNVGEQVEKDRYSVGSAEFNGTFRLHGNRYIDFTAHGLHDRSAGFPAGSGGPELAILRQSLRDNSNEVVLGASLKDQTHSRWIYSIDSDLVKRAEDNSTPAVLDQIQPTFRSLPSSVANTDFARMRIGGTSNLILRHNLSAGLGLSVRRESGSMDGFLKETIPQSFRLDRTSLLATSELQYSTSRLTATAGVSFDKSNGYEEVSSPRIGLAWLTADRGPRFKTSWAKGFKLPSFYALGNPSIGNPFLRPERANSFDAEAEYPVRTRITTSLTYFHNHFEDLVDFDTTTFHLINRSQAIMQGLEIGASYATANNIHLGLDFSYTTWVLHRSNQPLRNIPHGNGGIHFDWKASNRLRVGIETQWMGRRYDFQIPVPNEGIVGGYSDTNASATYDLTSRTSIYLRGNNVLNSKYHEYIGFPNPGIAMRFGLVYHVK
jgi:outer membrane cobalamin receptor